LPEEFDAVSIMVIPAGKTTGSSLMGAFAGAVLITDLGAVGCDASSTVLAFIGWLVASLFCVSGRRGFEGDFCATSVFTDGVVASEDTLFRVSSLA
jgi:hypothetical protein